jgi:hypothetical protein
MVFFIKSKDPYYRVQVLVTQRLLFFFFLFTGNELQGRFQDLKLEGAHLKKLRRAEGDAKFFWDISCAPLLDPPLS